VLIVATDGIQCYFVELFGTEVGCSYGDFYVVFRDIGGFVKFNTIEIDRPK
jgi:hypothetical protein